MIDYLKIYIEPFWAVRTTKQGRFSERATQYHDKMNSLRLLIWSEKSKIIEHLLNSKYQINFFHEMPKSWSKKKQEKMEYKFKETMPDVDNLHKAFLDTIFYNTWINDSKVFRCNSYKLYAWVWEKWFIEFIFEK